MKVFYNKTENAIMKIIERLEFQDNIQLWRNLPFNMCE